MRVIYILILCLISLGLVGCGSSSPGTLNKVGLLLTDTVNDEGWNKKGYEGLLNIRSNLNVDIYFKEGIVTYDEIIESIKEFDDEGVKLIFGHGRLYTSYFMELKEEYPHIHFVVFNGDVNGDNITSIHFKAHAMGFFGGMVAAAMSENQAVGIIGAFPWQPEVEGFVEGAKYQNEHISVYVEYVSGWGTTSEEKQKAIEILEEMTTKGVDVFYPTGDGFHVSIIEEIKRAGLYVIGYIGEQSDLGESTVLTSTIQNVDALYTIVAENYNSGNLQSGNLYYDFDNQVISLGNYGTNVPEELQQEINKAIDEYINTGLLPNQKKSQ